MIGRFAAIYLVTTILMLLSFLRTSDREITTSDSLLSQNGSQNLAEKADSSVANYDQVQNNFGAINASWREIFKRSNDIPTTFLYSAYIDTRNSDKFLQDPKFRLHQPSIRALLLMEAKHRLFVKSKHKQLMAKIFSCHLPALNLTVAGTLYEQCENHNFRYGAYILNCPLIGRNFSNFFRTPDAVVLQFQLLTENSWPQEKSGLFPVTKSISSTSKSANSVQKITLCISGPLFGERYTFKYMVEYLELARLLGIGHVILYVSDFGSNPFYVRLLRNVFAHYESIKFLTVLNFTLPSHDSDIKPSQVW